MFRKIVYRSFGVAALVLLASSSTGAIVNAKRTTFFTFSKPVQLPGVALPAGTYVFEVVNPFTGSNVVTVLSPDRSRVYLLRITNRIERSRASALKPMVTLGEAPAGNPPTIKAWFPDSETSGHAFIY